MLSPATSSPSRPQGRAHRAIRCATIPPGASRVDALPEPLSRWRSSPEPGPIMRRWHGARKAVERRPDVPVRTDTRNRPDHHFVNGRAAPRHHRRPMKRDSRSRRTSPAAGAYKETITQCRAEGRFIRQSACRASTSLSRSSSTAERGRRPHLREQDRRRRHPARVHPACTRYRGATRWRPGGVPDAVEGVQLIDGSYHDVDSSEMAFKIAGSHGVPGRGAARQAGAARPVMDVGLVPASTWRSHRRPEFAARQDRRHVPACRRARRRGQRAAVGNVRLRNTPALLVPGAGGLLDAVLALRPGAGERGGDGGFEGRGSLTRRSNGQLLP